MLLLRCLPIQRTALLPNVQAAGRVLSQDIASPVNLPGFDRAAMDGFAVRSLDTRGAKPNAPVFLDNFQPVRTGMPVPGCYDAVVMLEDSRKHDTNLEITTQLHAYKNISPLGEDIRQGETVFSQGHTLRPPDVAMLSALGIDEVRVYEKPKVVIIPTGGELVAIGARTRGGILLPGEFATLGCQVQLCTEDGSAGLTGLVTEAVDQALPASPRAAAESIGMLYGCGPQAMLEALRAMCHAHRVPCQLCFEAVMKCALGVCGSCARDGFLVCKDGPVFAWSGEGNSASADPPSQPIRSG